MLFTVASYRTMKMLIVILFVCLGSAYSFSVGSHNADLGMTWKVSLGHLLIDTILNHVKPYHAKPYYAKPYHNATQRNATQHNTTNIII